MSRGRKVHTASDRVQSHMRREAESSFQPAPLFERQATPVSFKDLARQREAEFRELERRNYRALHSDTPAATTPVHTKRGTSPKRASDAWIDAIVQDTCETEAGPERVRHHDTIGVYSAPEPKHILQPAPKSRLRWEPPVRRYSPARPA